MREELFHVVDRERIGRASHHRGEYGTRGRTLHVYDNGESASITYEGPQGEICTAAVIEGDDLGRFVEVINPINDRRINRAKLAEAEAKLAEAEIAADKASQASNDARMAFRIASNDRDSAYAAERQAHKARSIAMAELEELKAAAN